MKKLFLLIIGIGIITQAFSQQRYSTRNKKAAAAFEKARIYYETGKDSEALDELQKALKYDPDFIEAHMVLADIAYDAGNYEMCVKEYLKAIEIDPKFYHNNYYNLAKAYMQLGEYDNAIKYLDFFLNTKNEIRPVLKEKALQLKANAEFAKYAVEHPVPFEPKNLGENINSEYEEYHPAITADDQMIIFTRKIPFGPAGGARRNYHEDFYYSLRDENGNWRPALNMGPPINTGGNEGAQSISPDGRGLYFTACDRKDGVGSCDLYYAERKGNKWTNPQNIKEINSHKWDSQPSMSSDGKTLYFSSSRPGGKGGADIWRAVKNNNGTWGKPENININTPGDEMSPFIHPDGKTLYFASNGLPGMGGFDLYVATLQEDGNFSEPKNLGYPINTAADEHGMIVNAQGNLAYFSSGRSDGYGLLDIYAFELYADARPTSVTYAKGMVYDAVTKKPLSADIELIDLATNEKVVNTRSDELNGGFLVCLPVDKDYALNVRKDGYLFYSENFSLKGHNDSKPYLLEVPLQPISVGKSVVLKNVFFETGKYDLKPESKAELDKLVEFLKNNPDVKIEIGGHTDSMGNDADNQVLSENRAKAVYDYLIRNGVSAERLSYKGYGENQPIASNETEEGRQKNRRTEFKIIGL
ncbi:MAG: tetratricopeptide repeat protein [Bacteroidetes bacterium]|nr:MAG: tetratricopeptide repeat protein [Bacteroidota bacterium]